MDQQDPQPVSGNPGWNLTPEFPTREEILASAQELADLPHNNINAPWPSKEAYLATQYAILRREATEGLRHAVNSFRSAPNIRDNDALCVYKKVSVLSLYQCSMGSADTAIR